MSYSKQFKENGHAVYLLTGLVKGDGIQSNQLFIENHHHSALFDLGGNLTFQPVQMAISKISSIKELDYLIATHQDLDIITSIDNWLMYTDARVVISKLGSFSISPDPRVHVTERRGQDRFHF